MEVNLLAVFEKVFSLAYQDGVHVLLVPLEGERERVSSPRLLLLTANHQTTNTMY